MRFHFHSFSCPIYIFVTLNLQKLYNLLKLILILLFLCKLSPNNRSIALNFCVLLYVTLSFFLNFQAFLYSQQLQISLIKEQLLSSIFYLFALEFQCIPITVQPQFPRPLIYNLVEILLIIGYQNYNGTVKTVPSNPDFEILIDTF